MSPRMANFLRPNLIRTRAEKIEFLLERIEVDAAGCWLWGGYVEANGYGRIGKDWAHRRSYELLVGSIPTGLELDHLCRVTLCVNPDHLEPVTPRVNQRRGNSPAGRHARQTHCVNGHAFDEENTYWWKGRRYCRTCNRTSVRRAQRARREAAQ